MREGCRKSAFLLPNQPALDPTEVVDVQRKKRA
jgi:hypothetical protein